MNFKKKNTKIIILSGKARSGKNTVSTIIKNYYKNLKVVTISFGGYVKQYAKQISDWDGSEESKPRKLLQELGIKLIKEQIDDKLFIKRIIEDIEVLSYFCDIIIVSDARLIDEIVELKKVYPKAISIRILKDNHNDGLTIKERNDITETNLDNYLDFDFIINNKDNLVKLKLDVERILINMNHKIVAIDGPAGSGKGTIAKLLAKKCNLLYIDTGAMYRAIAYLVLKNKIDITDSDSIVKIALNSKMSFVGDELFVNDINISDKIRTIEVTNIVSPISSIPELREILVKEQRLMAGNNNVIMEGRDITTVVFPNATYKFYLDASIEERANRRYIENKNKGYNVSLKKTLEDIKARDYNDIHKKVGALIRTEDSIYIDTTNMTIDEVVSKMQKIIEGD